MKKKFMLLLLAAITVFLLSCRKGAAGPAGVTGTEGILMLNMQDGLYPFSDSAFTADTYIQNGAPDGNYGGCVTMRAGITGPGNISRLLVKFDTSDQLPHVTAIKAYLSLYVQQLTGSVSIRAYKMSVPWDEGLGACTGAAGSATWNDSASGIAWSAPGGAFAASAVSDSVTITGTGYVTLTINAVGFQDWMDSRSPVNFMIKADNETGSGNYADFSTKEEPVVIERPRLTIYYCLR
jgi:hypothetical protein